MSSRQREDALPGLRSSLTAEFAPVTGTTAFGTTVRTDGGRMLMTPNWKSVTLVLLVLYPTVMLLLYAVMLLLFGSATWLQFWDYASP